MDLFNNVTVLSLEQATVLSYMTFRLVQDDTQVCRLEPSVYGEPNGLIGGIAEMIAEIYKTPGG